jgi:hypothetical protein
MIAARIANRREGQPSKKNSANLQSNAEAARAMNVSTRSVESAKTVLKEGGPGCFLRDKGC